MKNRNLTSYLILFAVVCFLLAGVNCSTKGDGKIPVTTSSKNAREYYLEGLDLFEKLRFQESRQYFEKAIEEDTNFALAYLLSANVQPSVKGLFEKLDKAVALADKVSEGERLWILGFKAAVEGLPMKQREYFQQMVTAYPQDERAHTLLGNNYFAQQDYTPSIEEYNKAIQINPDYSQPYNQLGYAYRFLENYPEAEKAFKKYIELIPDDPNPYDSYAELLMKMGRFDESIETYRKALTINPDFTQSYLGIAANHNFKGEYEKAREQLLKLYDIAKTSGQRRTALFSMAISYMDEGKTEQALSELKKGYAFAEETNDASAMAGDHITMGNILLESGKYNEARAEFDKALKLVKATSLPQEVKDNAERGYLYNAARIDLLLKNFSAAKAKAEEFRAKVEAINNPVQIRLAHELTGMIALEEKDYDKALEELQLTNQQNPYNLYRIALAYKGKGDQEKGKEFCIKAAEFNAIDGVNFVYGRKKARQLLDSM